MDRLLRDQVFLLKKGNTQAFEIIFKQYAPRILKYAAKYFNNLQDCEEVAQEVFIKLWNKRDTLDKVETFESLLFTIAKNHIYNVVRKKVYHKAFKNHKLLTGLNESYDPDEEQNFTELFVLIKTITRSLPEQRRKVFVLSRFKGYSNKEISKHLQISTNTVETHMRLALKKFREILRQNNYLPH